MENFNWDDLRILIAIDNAGTLLGAARMLGVSHSTVHRRLAAIEKAFNAKLFRRQNNSLVRTEVSHSIIDQARQIGQDVSELSRLATTADQGVLSGSVQVAGPHAMVAGFVAQQLPQFYKQYPDIRVTLRGELGVNLLLRGEADIGLRISMPVSDVLDIRRVAVCRFGLYGIPNLAAALERELRRGGVLKTPFVDFSTDHAEMPESRWLKQLFLDTPPRTRGNSTPLLYAAARAGMGVAALPCYVGDRLPGLKRIPTPVQGPSEGLFLVTRREQRGVARVRALVDFLTKTIAANKSLFSGDQGARSRRNGVRSRGTLDA